MVSWSKIISQTYFAVSASTLETIQWSKLNNPESDSCIVSKLSNLWSKIVYSRMGTFLKVQHNIFLCLYCLKCSGQMTFSTQTAVSLCLALPLNSQNPWGLCVTLHTERRPEGIMSNWHNTDTCIYFDRTEATVLINHLTQLFTCNSNRFCFSNWLTTLLWKIQSRLQLVDSWIIWM